MGRLLFLEVCFLFVQIFRKRLTIIFNCYIIVWNVVEL